MRTRPKCPETKFEMTPCTSGGVIALETRYTPVFEVPFLRTYKTDTTLAYTPQAPYRGLHFGTSFVRIRDGHFFNARRHMYRASVVHFEDLLLILYKTQGPVIYPEGVLTCALFTDKKPSLFAACERNSEQLFTFPIGSNAKFWPRFGLFLVPLTY